MTWACMAATGTRTHVLNDDVTADGSCTMDSKMNKKQFE